MRAYRPNRPKPSAKEMERRNRAWARYLVNQEAEVRRLAAARVRYRAYIARRDEKQRLAAECREQEFAAHLARLEKLFSEIVVGPRATAFHSYHEGWKVETDTEERALAQLIQNHATEFTAHRFRLLRNTAPPQYIKFVKRDIIEEK